MEKSMDPASAQLDRTGQSFSQTRDEAAAGRDHLNRGISCEIRAFGRREPDCQALPPARAFGATNRDLRGRRQRAALREGGPDESREASVPHLPGLQGMRRRGLLR